MRTELYMLILHDDFSTFSISERKQNTGVISFYVNGCKQVPVREMRINIFYLHGSLITRPIRSGKNYEFLKCGA